MTTLTTSLMFSSILPVARGVDFNTQGDVVVPQETAASEILNQSERERTLRIAGLDLFPHAAGTILYDDNLLISHTNEVAVTELTLSPGLTVVGGDVATAFPSAVTMEQLRSLRKSSLMDDSSKSQRFFGIDYTANLNLFVDHPHFNNVDHFAGLIASYAFSRLTIGLDQDFKREAEKNNLVGERVTIREYDTDIRNRYEFTDRTFMEINGHYLRFEYEDGAFRGYNEFRNDDWLIRNFNEKLSVGLGAAFGVVFPDANPRQTYQQALGRVAYKLSGKINLIAEAGAEVREYNRQHAETFHPAFNVMGIYQPWSTTTLSLSANEREEPAPSAFANYTTYGFNAGVRQLLFNRLYAGVNAGYNDVNFISRGSGGGTARTDGFYFARVGFDYELNPHWTTSLFYTHNQNNSTSPEFSYNENVIGARIGWQF
jgi:hypothetical protein